MPLAPPLPLPLVLPLLPLPAFPPPFPVPVSLAGAGPLLAVPVPVPALLLPPAEGSPFRRSRHFPRGRRWRSHRCRCRSRCCRRSRRCHSRCPYRPRSRCRCCSWSRRWRWHSLSRSCPCVALAAVGLRLARAVAAAPFSAVVAAVLVPPLEPAPDPLFVAPSPLGPAAAGSRWWCCRPVSHLPWEWAGLRSADVGDVCRTVVTCGGAAGVAPASTCRRACESAAESAGTVVIEIRPIVRSDAAVRVSPVVPGTSATASRSTKPGRGRERPVVLTIGTGSSTANEMQTIEALRLRRAPATFPAG